MYRYNKEKNSLLQIKLSETILRYKSTPNLLFSKGCYIVIVIHEENNKLF